MIGQERLIREAFEVLVVCFPQLSVQELRITVQTVNHGSLESDLRAVVVGMYATELGAEMPDILQALLELMSRMPMMVGYPF